MAKWLGDPKKKVKQLLDREGPRVTVVGTSSASIPHTDFANISVYQPSLARNATTIHSAVSPNRELFHLILVTTRHDAAHATAVARASKQAWLDVSVKHVLWNQPFRIVEEHVEHLSRLVYDVSHATLSFDHIGLTIDRASQKITLGTSLSGSVTAVSHDLEVRPIETALHSFMPGQGPSQSFSPDVISTSTTRALVITPQASQSHVLKSSISNVLKVPYPLAGAAELTYFALNELGQPSDVTWIEILR